MKYIRPLLWTNQLKETVEFYTRQLGFTCGAHNEEWQWAAFYRDDIEIMASIPNAHSLFVKPVFTGSFYITTDKVEELWQELKDKAVLCYPIETFEYGMKEFALFDNNGYLLQFGQEVD